MVLLTSGTGLIALLMTVCSSSPTNLPRRCSYSRAAQAGTLPSADIREAVGSEGATIEVRIPSLSDVLLYQPDG